MAPLPVQNGNVVVVAAVVVVVAAVVVAERPSPVHRCVAAVQSVVRVPFVVNSWLDVRVVMGKHRIDDSVPLLRYFDG